MRRLVLGALAVLGACGFDVGGLPAGGDIKDDTAADFLAAGSSLESAEIDDAGLITPSAWATGATLAKGANSELFTDPATADWNMIDATTPSGTAFAAPLGDYGDGAPVGVGLAQADNFTMWMSGEIWLEAGTHTFQLTADDNGLLELAQPGGAFTRVVTAQWFQGPQMGTYTIGSDGWYPIHMAMSESNGQASYLLAHQPPGATALAPLDPDRLRVALGGARGVVADAFDDFYLVTPVGRSLFAAPMLDEELGSTVPKDTGITAASTYSFHWTAQVLVTVAGDYGFLADSVAGHRVRIDGQLLSDALSGQPQVDTTSTVHLDPGWHDVVMDYTEMQSSAHARLYVSTGPELDGAPFPAARVRPVIPRVDRVAAAADQTDLFFAANGTVDYTLSPGAPAGAIVGGVDLAYTVNDQHDNDLVVSAIGPDGTTVVLHTQSGTDLAGPLTERHTLHDFDGKAAEGAWKIEVVDKGGRAGGNTRDGALTVHYTGGHAPIAPVASYDSQVRDLGAVETIDLVTFGASAPSGAGVAVRLRTGANADDLMAQPWSDPIESGSPPIVAPGRFVQYRVELSSDGDHSAAFDWIELVYRPST